MQKFLFKILIFVLIIGTSLFTVSFIADLGLKKSRQQEWASWNDIFNSKVNDSIAILGSSRVHSGYNPKIIESNLGLSCYNLGMNGYTIDLIKQRYNVLLKYNTVPKYVILNIDYHTTFEISYWPYQMTQYLPYQNECLFDDYFARVGWTWKKRYIPMYKYLSCVDKVYVGWSEFFHPKDDVRYKGFWNEKTAFEGKEMYSQLEKNEKFNVPADKNALELCSRFLKGCQRNGIVVIAVMAPYYHIVIENMNKKNKLIVDEYIKFIQDSFNIKVLDYTYFLSQDSTCFANGTHLSKKGADLFTEELSKDLKEIIKNE